jgi:uncharacterized protein
MKRKRTFRVFLPVLCLITAIPIAAQKPMVRKSRFVGSHPDVMTFQALRPPDDLSVTAVSPTRVRLSWRNGSTAQEGVKIERRTGSNGIYTVISRVGISVSGFEDTQVNPGMTYFFRVAAYQGTSTSVYSNEVSVNPLAARPTPPGSLAAIPDPDTPDIGVRLNWQDKADNEDFFEIERKSAGGNYEKIGGRTENSNSYEDHSARANMTYWYRVRAGNGVGMSEYSNEAMVATLAPRPVMPTNLTGDVISPFQVDLHWQDNSDNEEGFMIKRRQGEGEYSQVAVTNADATSYSDRGLTSNTVYYYQVIAFNGNGNSPCSNVEYSSTIQSYPIHLTQNGFYYNQVNLLWDNPNNLNKGGWSIERMSAGSQYAEIANPDNTGRSYYDKGVTPMVTYTYRVKFQLPDGIFHYSNKVTVTTPDTPPAGLEFIGIAQVSSDEVQIKWRDDSDNEEGIIIERAEVGVLRHEIARVPSNTTTYSDKPVVKNMTYQYTVRAFNGGGTSTPFCAGITVR